VNNYDHALDTIARLKKQKREFRELLAEKKRRGRATPRPAPPPLTLSRAAIRIAAAWTSPPFSSCPCSESRGASLLASLARRARPVSDRPARRSYRLLLEQLKKFSGAGDPELPQLERALDSISTICTKVNEDRRRLEGHQRMLEVQARLSGAFDLFDKNRALVMEAPLAVKRRSSTVSGPLRAHARVLAAAHASPKARARLPLQRRAAVDDARPRVQVQGLPQARRVHAQGARVCARACLLGGRVAAR
jgi:hypothetical protein